MIHDITEGISQKLYEIFGDKYERHTQQVRQGLHAPCFHIFCVSPTHSPLLGTRTIRGHLFSIEYFPESETEAITECYAIQDRLFLGLEYITVNGKLVRGTKRSGRIVDGVLVFTVNFDLIVRSVPEITDPTMGSLTITNQVGG